MFFSAKLELLFNKMFCNSSILVTKASSSATFKATKVSFSLITTSELLLVELLEIYGMWMTGFMILSTAMEI